MTKKYKISSVTLAPVQLVELLDCPTFTDENMASFKFLNSGGGYVSKQLVGKLQKVMPQCTICVVYALTETGGIAINIGCRHNDSVGQLFPNI